MERVSGGRAGTTLGSLAVGVTMHSETTRHSDADLVAAARGKVREAVELLDESDRLDVHLLLLEALVFLARVGDPERAEALREPVLAEIAAVRSRLRAATPAPVRCRTR